MNSPLKTEKEGIIGALPPPSGIVPNFEHPKSQGNRIIIAIAILLPLATLVLSLRIYTKRMIVRTIGFDDYAIILEWLLSIGFAIAVVFALNFGLGVHLWDVPLTTFSHALKIGIINGVFYGLSLMCTKLSILLLYLRLSPYRPFRISVWIVALVIIIYSLLGSFEFLFNCRPIAKNWDITISGGSCIDVAKILMVHGILNIATDIAMLVLPVMLVYKLQLPMKQKVAVAGLFMTGTLVCIVSAIRLKSVWDLIHSADATWSGADFYIWTIIEVYVGIICACLISFKPFFRHHFPRLLGSSYRSAASTSYLSKRTVNIPPNTSTAGHELESYKGLRKSSIRRQGKQQTDADNESQEDILRDVSAFAVVRQIG